MKRMSCQVELLSPILDDVYNVVLTPDQNVDFTAGQYLQVVMADDDKRPFSIANAPGQHTLELHIGAPANNGYAGQVIERLHSQPSIDVELPFGRATIDKVPPRDVLVMVGGTGFSYAKSLIEYLNQIPHQQRVYLYWGGRNLGGLYLFELAQQWHDDKKIEFVPVIEQSIAHWQGKIGLVHEAVLADFPSMSELDVYIAGRFEMAAVARDAFVAQGLPLSQLHADAYEFI
ncbi:NAD(P)H-flavin reductase [Celerinatantimonas yamalensis]|uniref:NAD(P)H-flavin reductase n=1 Tax=Celerinatantimonas yamalensis TaxID=559956 RepID=A0ABW9GB90_9GAMM